MSQPSPSDLLILARTASGDGRCTITVHDGEVSEQFRLEFQDAAGIRLLVEIDPLTRWLRERGMLWALRPICRDLDAAVLGRAPPLPHRIRCEDTP